MLGEDGYPSFIGIHRLKSCIGAASDFSSHRSTGVMPVYHLK